MRLERLEISGFKSFSDRSELAFDKGVTAIVGPNGCGKSNVADAITWVLGEQSAKSLRGDRMEDVIFSGSDARKPGAAAEVRLRLSGLPLPQRDDDVTEQPELHPQGSNGNGRHRKRAATGNGSGNGNGNGTGHHIVTEMLEAFTREVEVTRRLYRSGESEYLIDGEVCRLRDVHELLMDTGLGAKAYAIIEQGKIGMILSSRPTDRRQLIEEAAGITKYRSRRRAAEFKLEAAQQNLTRIDDIVFEVEKQCGTLKRQAAKARRYRRLREELRRWEKVLFARRYRELAQTIDAARARLGAAREREAAAAARLVEVESDLGRLRIEQAEADNHAAAVREDAHARDLDINRRQQQVEFNRHHAETLVTRAQEVSDEIRDLDTRREPARLAIESRRRAALEAENARDEAAAVLTAAGEAHALAQRRIEGLESDVEAARAEVFAAINSATALRHAIEHATAQQERVAEIVAKLDVERDDVGRERERIDADRVLTSEALNRIHQAMEAVHLERSARESELATARAEHEWRARMLRTREQELASLEGRLASLEELEVSRAGFGDAARMVLIQANGHVGQQGAVADYLDVDTGYERAVEASLGELLQHVIVERHEQATAGLALVREHDAGRCGFVVVDPGSNGYHPRELLEVPGLVPVSQVLRVTGPYAATIQKVLPEAYVAESFEQAVTMARQTTAPVATIEGDVFRGPHLLSGGAGAETRGILQTKREIKELKERVACEREALTRLSEEMTALDFTIAQAITAVAALHAEQHRQEKAIVGHEAQLSRTTEDAARLARKADVVALERRRADQEGAALEARLAESHESLSRLQDEQRGADERLSESQRALFEARDTVQELSARAAEARATHAGLVERSAALSSEIERLADGARELEARIGMRTSELQQIEARREVLLVAICEGERMLDEDIRALVSLRDQVRAADDAAGAVRQKLEAQDVVIRDARRVVEEIRERGSELEVARATAEKDLSHLAQSCADTVQTALDAVLAEVEQLEQSGHATPDAAAFVAEDTDSDIDDTETTVDQADMSPTDSAPDALSASSGSMTAEEAILQLRAKIDRLGPVNMMAIEQFDELETRHAFLTTQRKDLMDSIAQTAEAIKRIDQTTNTRFNEAFVAIQHNFQGTFSTLFGGGRAGLTLLDESDPLESGIDIVASPPGKRLQSVQLLSGGEKALTAIALMFAIFQYKPSPFCLLDEIDAPLDDANVSRFVEMLRGMLDRTQFIVITHNRRTMEIADRLYGVTMEEPGISKLISVQLN
jgi:chromosome segregation protein